MKQSKTAIHFFSLAFALVLGAGTMTLSACGGTDDDTSSGNGSLPQSQVNYCEKTTAQNCDNMLLKTASDCEQMSAAFFENMPKCRAELEASSACSEKNMDPKCVAGPDGKTSLDDGVGDKCKAEREAVDKCMEANYNNKEESNQ